MKRYKVYCYVDATGRYDGQVAGYNKEDKMETTIEAIIEEPIEVKDAKEAIEIAIDYTVDCIDQCPDPNGNYYSADRVEDTVVVMDYKGNIVAYYYNFAVNEEK